MKKHYYKNGKFVFLLFVLLSLLALKPNQVMAQTLKTDGIVPALDACGASGTFTVAIEKGSNPCNAGTLQIALPTTGFEYVAGSAKIGTTALAETNVTATGATLTLPAITSGVATDLVIITYQVRATCEAIPMATLPDESKPTVTYTLNGCSATAQTGQSDIININFAVLKVEVNPNASQGVIGSSITRTIKVTNNGNGSVNSFTIERTMGASLTLGAVNQPTGWAVDASNPNKYIYTGSSLTPGASVNLTETVNINSCNALQTTFETYYGCVGKCTLGNANGTVTAGVSIDQSIQPKLDVTVITTPTINCFNKEYEFVWKITNNGTGYSSAAKLFLTIDGATDHHSSYFNPNSITVNGVSVGVNAADVLTIANTSTWFGTQGKIWQLSFNVPDLAPGESKEIRFKQYYAAPVADCAQDLTAFFRSYTAYIGSYKNRDGCTTSGVNPDIVIPFNQTNVDAHYAFGGLNVGEVDIVNNYNADFKFYNWDFPSEELQAGAYLDIILQLSGSLQAGFDMSKIKLVEPNANLSLTPLITDLGGGKYRLRITYGSADWPLNTRPQRGGFRLQFPVTMSCATSTAASYTVTGQLNKGGGCADLVQFQCQTVNLNSHCPGVCVNGGLDNGNATLKRMSYGKVATNPDNGTPDLSATAVDPNNPPANFATRYFIGTDTVQISQTGKVVNGAATPAGGWIAGTFSVASPAELASIAIPNTGKVTITRGANVYTVTGLAINTGITNNFSIDLSIINLLKGTNNLPVGFTYQDNDVIVSSLQIQPRELINAATGIKEFPTTYVLNTGGNGYACGSNFRATGYYGPTWLQFFTGSASNITSCDPTITNIYNSPSFLYLFREVEFGMNNMFPNEFRQVAIPKKAIFTVPAGLQLVGARVDINNNSTTGNLSKTITLPSPISNGNYTLDVEQVIKDLKGGAYLDEGWEVRVWPMVQPTCKSTGSNETILIEGTMAGTFWHRFSNYQEVQFRNSPEVSLGQIGMTYNTDNNMLSATVTQANVLATTSQAKWVVQVANSSSFRTFGNVWMGQSATSTGGNIVSVQQVTDLNGTTPIGVTTTSVNGVFQLGDFNTGATGSKYYLVTADYNSCDPGNISLVYGADCNGYPTSVASATCSTALTTLNYTPVFANLQTSIVSQNAGTARPKLCEQIPYEIQVNNAGLGDATSLVVSVRLPLAGGLSYVPGTLQLTAPFAATPGAYSAITDASANVSTSAIVFTIPVANVPALKNGEKFLLKFDLTPQGCTFQSGQRISFSASGKNGCGSDIANTNAATSNRVTIDGAPTNLPDLSVTLASTATNLTAAGTDLTADYNFTLKNIGDGINNYPVTTAYSFNVKLPAGWAFAGNPQDLVPIAQANYVGLDPVKGYVYHLAQDLPAGAEIKMVNASMVYANATAIACNTNFGPIYESVFTTFSPQSLCVGAPCQIDQLSVDNQTTILIAPKPTAPAGTANQTFCAGNTPTLASIVVTNAGVLNWYDSATSTTPIANTTVLADGSVYYAANKLVDGGVCESDRLAVTIKLDLMPTVNAGPDQTIYTGSQFTMAGNNPVAPQTGVWTEVVATGETAQATITNPNNYNTTVNVASGKTVTLRWTITNGSCSTFDDVVLVNVPENDLSVEKTADKSSVIAGEDLTYTIVIKNAGPGVLPAGAAIGLTETLPPAFINPIYTATGGVYDAAANTFTLAAGMTTGDMVTLSIKGTVTSSFTGTNIINKVTIQAPAGITDSNLTNNEDEVTTPVTRTTDLSVTKVADKASIVAGESLKYTITITNNGLSTLLAGEAIGVTETLPTGFSGLTYTATGGTYSAAASTFTLAAALANGQSVSFTINGTVDANYNAATIVNTVVISAPTGVTDPTPGNNTATVTTPVTRTTDLSVTKVADKASIVAGESLKYTITITNNGLSTLLAGEAIGVKETLPTGFSGLTYTATGGTYNAAASTFTLAAAMANGQSVSFTINGTVDANYNAATIVNTVVISAPTGVTDPTPGNNTATVSTPVRRSINLAVVKTADKTTVVAGENLVYTIRITNNGSGTLLAGEVISVTEALPTGFNGLTYASIGGTYNATTNSFTLSSSMATGESVSFTISGTVNANYNAANIANTVTVAPPAGIVDPVPGDNTSTVTIPVTRTIDLSVTKMANQASVVAGDPLQYTITITNNGPTTLLANEVIKVTETLPTGFNGLTYASTGGNYNAAAGTFTLAAAMATGQSVSFTISGTIAARYSASEIVNTVLVAPPTGVNDPTPGNNTSTVTTPVVRVTDLSVIKTANKTTVVAGEALIYTLTITNNGQSTLFANETIPVTETLPTNLTGVTFASSNGVYSNGLFKLAADLPQGASVMLTVSGIVSSASAGGSNVTNVVTIATPPGVTDPVPANNTDNEVTPVIRIADLSVVKTASVTSPVVGTDFTFTIKAKNNGPSDASSVVVNDLLPSGYTYVSATASAGSYVNATGIWTIGNLTNGAEATLTITVKVKPAGNYTNTATITGAETDPNLNNNSSTVTPTPQASPPVAIDDEATTKANNSVVIAVLTNDHPGLSESPLVPTSVQIISNPLHGTVKVNADGTVTYTPNSGYIGVDHFTYRVQDALGNWSNVANVKITIIINELHIPNVITPNGDGKNDTFEIVGIEGYDNATITIFNRWGNEVYKNGAYKNTWDGFGLNEGTYYYLIRLKKGSSEDTYKGWVLLKR
ncbi:DUF11 domain-containing protein [Agrobacterium tumefaciens]|nr:DUF11 domain-containing protein [Agrobacterium tumefaciens]